MPTIVKLEAAPLDIELTEPFGIACGAQTRACNAVVRLSLEDGTVGLGEAAPFPAVSGETQDGTLAALERARGLLVGTDPGRWRRASAILLEALPDAPAARCALETALLDALARRHGISLWRLFGGAEPELVTDITVVTGTADRARQAAARAAEDGFDTLKIKVGGVDPDHDRARLRAVAAGAPSSRWVLDANGSMTAAEAVELVRSLGSDATRIAVFEQPTAPDDLDGARAVAERTGIPVAADESARSVGDIARVAAARAATVINLKITKSGVVQTLDMIAAARVHGLRLMVGGMVESPLAMTVSACVAAGIGGFAFVDLDTPLFMVSPPVVGGFTASGPRLRVDGIAAGHGVRLATGWPSAR